MEKATPATTRRKASQKSKMLDFNVIQKLITFSPIVLLRLPQKRKSFCNYTLPHSVPSLISPMCFSLFEEGTK